MASPHLSAPERSALEDRLRARQKELRAELRAQLEGSDDANVVGLRNRLKDTDDWAVADALSELDIAIVARDLRELSQVQAALRRLSEGAYGMCVECGLTIPSARLDANPWALRCVRCQEAVEKRLPGASPL